MLVCFIFKPLLHTSKRHMSVIFGNILTETGERQKQWGGRVKKNDKTLIHSTDCISRQSLLLACENCSFVHAMPTYQSDSPWGTFLWLSWWFTDSYIHTHTVQMTPTVLLFCTVASWASCLFYNLNSYPISFSDIMNNCISNQCGYMNMLFLKR